MDWWHGRLWNSRCGRRRLGGGRADLWLPDTWQLVINTGTTIVTFLMVFLIQRSQNKDALAIHLKLNEIVAAINGASNRLIEAEGLTEKELTALRRHYQELVALAAREADLTKSHSVEEAGKRHTAKKRGKVS
jgi:low affinity Fe/Cu permease